MSYGDLRSSLSNGGELSFEMAASKKAPLKGCIERANALEKAFQRQDGFYRRVVAPMFALYCSFRQLVATRGCREMANAVLVYQVAWRHISTIKGKDLPHDRIQVTYVGRS